VAIGLLFWLLLIRPQARRQREVRQMQASLAVGDEVMLTAGIYGVLRSLEDERVRVEIAPGTEIEVARGAVGQRVGRQDAAAGTEPERPEPESTDTTDDTTGER
jgi:preprotein translocase subunit YajC